MLALREEATKIANSVDTDYGIDPVTVVSVLNILLPILLKCFAQSGEQQTPRQYLLNHYDETTDSFDQWLIERVRSRTRLAARKAGKPRLDRGQLDALTEASFRHTIQADDKTVASCMSEVDHLSDSLE